MTNTPLLIDANVEANADSKGTREEALASALRLLLDQVDYTAGACRAAEMVGAVLDTAVIRRVRDVLAS